jgi:hypothetical protein
MKLSEATANYVAHKQSMGMRFRTEARTLKSFCHAMGEMSLQQVSPDGVHAYLAGTGPRYQILGTHLRRLLPVRHRPRLCRFLAAAMVPRLVSWYRSGVDLQRLLPQLSTYLGHINVQGGAALLTLTPELLREASDRFERYAMGPSHE